MYRYCYASLFISITYNTLFSITKYVGLTETVNKANNAVPASRAVNGKALTRDIYITSQDIFNGQAIAIPERADLNDYQTPGLYYQGLNVQAESGSNYPESLAGSLVVLQTAGVTQRYFVYNSSRIYTRSLYSWNSPDAVWSPWAREYNTLNKPTVSELGLSETVESAKNALPRESAWSFTSGAHTISSDSNYATLMLESNKRRTVIQTQPPAATDMLAISYEDKSIYIPKKSGTLATLDDITIPVGVPLPYPSRYTPAGYLTCNGQAFDKSLYPKLAEAYPAGRVPDLRGEFIRGWDDSRSVDPGRVCGAWQGDAIQNITGAINFIAHTATRVASASGALATTQGGDWGNAASGGGAAENITFDASRVVRTANETRPRNIAFNYIVRAV